MTSYPIQITSEWDEFVARSRDFPELLTAGATREEVLANAADALRVCIEMYAKRNKPVPFPSKAWEFETMVSIDDEG